MAVPTLEEILAVGPGNYLNVGGKIYQPVFQESGSGENQVFGGPIAVMTYDLNKTGPGEVYNWTDLNTGITQRNEFTKSRGFFGDLLRDVGDVAKTVAPIAATALTMGGAGGLLGGALSGGALSGTAAKVLGNALISGGAGALTGQDPLKAALLAAGGTYAGSLFGGGTPQATVSDAQFIAADAAQLAAQGLSADQIAQNLQASGVTTGTAISAADVAASGMPVNEIANYISGKQELFTSGAPTPTTITASPEGLQTVTTTATPSAILPQATIPIVDLPSLESSGLMASAAPLATIAAPANEVIEVTAKKQPEQTIGDVAAAINAGTLYGPPMSGEQTAKFDEELAKKEEESKGLSLKDVYTALQALSALSATGMLGGDSGGTQQRPFVAPTGSVPMMDDNYYRAVQQYYNTFMPQTPRDVATPLQQWYQGNFGG